MRVRPRATRASAETLTLTRASRLDDMSAVRADRQRGRPEARLELWRHGRCCHVNRRCRCRLLRPCAAAPGGDVVLGCSSFRSAAQVAAQAASRMKNMKKCNAGALQRREMSAHTWGLKRKMGALRNDARRPRAGCARNPCFRVAQNMVGRLPFPQRGKRAGGTPGSAQGLAPGPLAAFFAQRWQKRVVVDAG